MKKLFFALMAVLAMTFAASCSKAAGELDDDPAKMTEQLKEQLDKKDGNKLVELVKAIPEKAAKFANSDKAKKYLDAAQTFLKENKSKVDEVLGKIDNQEARDKAVSAINGFLDLTPDKLPKL